MSSDTNISTTDSITINVRWIDRRLSSVLCVPPAAKMLTVIWLKPGNYIAQSLTKELLISAPTMADAKVKAIAWFKELLEEIRRQL